MDQQETVSLKEFFSEKINAQEEKAKLREEKTNLRFDALDKALILAHDDAGEKYEHLNKLRTEVTTDRGILVAKESCLRLHKDLTNWMNTVDKKLTILETRSITWTAAIGTFFLVIMLVMRWFGK